MSSWQTIITTMDLNDRFHCWPEPMGDERHLLLLLAAVEAAGNRGDEIDGLPVGVVLLLLLLDCRPGMDWAS